jgi:predicted nuclease of predicted toxin-antitoxin system
MKDRAMRFLANENVTGTVIQGLRQRGHDVLSVKESMRSEHDDVILARAQAEQRIVVTHDKDFGELAFRSQLPASCGVILFRLAGSDPDTDNQRILEALESRTDWTGIFRSSPTTESECERCPSFHRPEVQDPESAEGANHDRGQALASSGDSPRGYPLGQVDASPGSGPLQGNDHVHGPGLRCAARGHEGVHGVK